MTQAGLFDGFNSRAAARASDPVTSVMAAERAASGVSKGRLLALKYLYEHWRGLTDFELAELTGKAQTSIGKRRGDLMNPKYFSTPLVEKTGETRPSPSGSSATVWRLTRAGVEYYEKHLEQMRK